MYNISSDILNRFQSGNKQYARLTYGVNTIENERIIQGTFILNRYVETGESIGIGSTVAAELNLALRNNDGAYNNTDFLGTEAFVEVGVKDSNDDIQYVPFGYYTFEDSVFDRASVSLVALDRMLKFETAVGTITFPITVTNLLTAACTACSVQLDSSVTNLTNGSYSVTALPESVKTWREVLKWICEITGTNAYITREGKLMLKWFATSSAMTLTTANRTRSDVGKDVLSITGVTILSEDTKYSAGTTTRPISIKDNGIISHNHQDIANALNTKLNGYSYCSFSANILPAPHLDPMDVITFVKDSSNILCPVTDITFKLNGVSSLGCKSDQTAHGRSYGLQDATFYAHNIAAGSILADKIASGAITTDKLAALAVTAAKIAAGAITTDKLDAGAVTAEKISVADLQALGATIGGWQIIDGAIMQAGLTASTDVFYLNSEDKSITITKESGRLYDSEPYEEAFQTIIAEGLVETTRGVIGHGSAYNPRDYAVLDGQNLSVYNDKYSLGVSGAKRTRVTCDDVTFGDLTNDHSLKRLTPHLAQVWSSQIPANADLNTAAYFPVGQYFCGADVTAATLTNCPTGGLAFEMIVESPIQAEYDEPSGYTRYRVRMITTYGGAQYIQSCYKTSGGTYSFGEWLRVVDSSTALDNAVAWMKTQSGRLSSLDIGHSYNDDSRGRIRYDLSTSAQSGGANAVFGEGYVLTFMWDTAQRWDTQFYLPDADGNAPAFRTHIHNSGWNDVWRFQSEQISTVTTDGVTWTVVKHFDGYVEMYADITLNGTWRTWGSLYVLSLSGNTKSLPVTLTKKLADVTTYIAPESGVSSDSAFPVQYYMTTENSYACDIARPSAGANSKNYYCRKYIRGRI